MKTLSPPPPPPLLPFQWWKKKGAFWFERKLIIDVGGGGFYLIFHFILVIVVAARETNFTKKKKDKGILPASLVYCTIKRILRSIISNTTELFSGKQKNVLHVLRQLVCSILTHWFLVSGPRLIYLINKRAPQNLFAWRWKFHGKGNQHSAF